MTGSSSLSSWWQSEAQAARTRCERSGMPTPKLEAFKYMNLAPVLKKERETKLAKISVRAPQGVVVTKLSALQGKVGDRVREVLNLENQPTFFTDYAAGFIQDPFVITVPRGFQSENPLAIDWLSGEGWCAGVVVIVVEENASVSVIETYGDEADALSLVTAVSVGAGSRVSHLRIQEGDAEGFVTGVLRSQVARDAVFETAQVSLGSRMAREELTVELLEKGASAVTDGLFVARHNQLLDHHTSLVHKVGDTTSQQIYKGVLAEEGRGVFNGRIAIAHGASGSNSSQLNKNLVLSSKAEIDTKPELEIDNDDVKAAHGAAIGRLDPEHVFYLQARGMNRQQAVEILARGFAFEAVSRLSSQVLREQGQEAIEQSLRDLKWEMN